MTSSAKTIVPRSFRFGIFPLLLLFLALPVLPGRSFAKEAPAPAQRVFASPEAARTALASAVNERNRAELAAIFGPAQADLQPGDPVEEEAEFQHFAQHVGEGIDVVKEGENRAILQIGSEKWPFPIPIVKRGEGWLFDTAAGREEILNRRIGHNELVAINVCRSYVQAQHEYYDMPNPEGDQIPKYAEHMISRPGKRDGLYWPTSAAGAESPLGPLVAKAKEEGYMGPRQPGQTGPRPFHGYYFRILKAQGKSAPGGKYSYVINGNMVAGHAMVAYPSRWGVSGVMTFIVNQSGRVYQKNLGPKTAKIARTMKAYNPDPSWKLVQP